MKKLLNQPWFWIVLMILFCSVVPALAMAALEKILPEQIYWNVEEWFVLNWREGGVNAVVALFCVLSSLACMVGVWFVKGKTCGVKFAFCGLYFFLAVIALGVLMSQFGCAREKARRISCSSTLKQLQLAMQWYADEYAGTFPPDLETLRKSGCCENTSMFRCPGGRYKHLEFSDYLYYGKDRKITDPPFILLEDRERNHYGKYRNRIHSNGSLDYGTAK